jgi:transcription elongation factor S-II
MTSWRLRRFCVLVEWVHKLQLTAQTTKAGVAVGKLRTNANAEVSSLAKEIVRRWKEAVEEGKKRKRERDDGAEGKSEEPVKKAKHSGE